MQKRGKHDLGDMHDMQSRQGCTLLKLMQKRGKHDLGDMHDMQLLC
jgi:hypothetical protein